MKNIFSVLLVALVSVNLWATDPSVSLTTYYANIDGKSTDSNDALRSALCTIISTGYVSTDYGSLPTGIYAAKNNPSDFVNGDGKTLEDIYSSYAYTSSQSGSSATACGQGWNKEHTVPQSWFNGSSPMYSDAFHVYPTDIKMNSTRSSYPYGENSASKTCSDYGYGHVGTSTFSGYTGKVFDPGEGGTNGSYKGDLARTYFYMVTRYRTTSFTTGLGSVSFTYSGGVANLTTYMTNLMLKWHREDPVSEKERLRNNAIYAHQNNRNPFIDYPCLVEYIWGDKVGESVKLADLVSSYSPSFSGEGCPCDGPTLVQPSTDITCGYTSGAAIVKTITIKGVELESGDLTLSITGTNASLFTLSQSTISQANALAGQNITITYNPTAIGDHSAVLNISGCGLASAQTFNITGSYCATYSITLSRNGQEEVINGICGTYELPSASAEADACEGWEFQGWLAHGTSFTEGTTTAPTSYVTEATAAGTFDAIYAKESSSSAPIRTANPRRANAPVNTVLWAETFDGCGTTMPSTNCSGTTVYGSAVVSYSYEDGGGTTALFDATLAGGNSPELLIAKNGGSFTVSGIKTGGAKVMTFTFKTNQTSNLSVSSSTSGISVGSLSISSGTATCDITVTTDPSTFALTVTKNNSGNSREDNFQVIVKTAGEATTSTYKKQPCTLYNITCNSVANGTCTADKEQATEGATVTIEAHPNTGYQWSSWTVKDASNNPVTVTDNTFTMPASNVTVTPVFSARTAYTIQFSWSGGGSDSQTVYAGDPVSAPSVPDCGDYKFYGWSKNATVAETTTKSAEWLTGSFIPTENAIYYAVYKFTESGAGDPDTLTLNSTNLSTIMGGSYSSNDFSYSDITFGRSNAAIMSNSVQIKGGASNGVWNKTALGAAITQITVTYKTNNSTLTVGTSVKPTTNSESVSSTKTYNYNASDNLTYFMVCATSSYTQVSSIEVIYGGGSVTKYTSSADCEPECEGQLSTPVVSVSPGNEQLTLSWAAIANADHYTVTCDNGSGWSTSCPATPSIGTVTTGSTCTCVITGLTNGMEYHVTVVANGTTICDSEAGEGTGVPQACTAWTSDPTLAYTASASTGKNLTPTLTQGNPNNATFAGTLSYSSSNPAVATVDASTGEVTTVGAGTTTITLTYSGSSTYCDKVVTSNTITVTGNLSVAFDKNASDATGSMENQSIPYNTATALNACAYTRYGYTFAGWATTSDGAVVYTDQQLVTLTAGCTLYAKWTLNNHDVTFSPNPSGGSVTVNGSSTSPQSAGYNTTVTVTTTPAEHYSLGTITVSSGAIVTIDGNTGTFTMPDQNVTVTVTFVAETKYNAVFYNMGGEYETKQFYVGETITKPTVDPSACTGYTFVGWSATEQTTPSSTSPTIVTTFPTMTSAGASYYAVYSYSEGGGGSSFVPGTTTSGSFTISSGDYYAQGTGSKLNGVAAASADQYLFTQISGNTYSIKLGSYYITYSSNTNLGTSTSSYSWTITAGTNGDWRITSTATNTRGLIFRGSSTNQFGGYSTSNVTSTSTEYYDVSIGGGSTTMYTTAPACCDLEKPSNLAFESTSGTAGNLTWSITDASGITSFKIVNASTSAVVASGISSGDRSYAVTGLTECENYSYKVVSVGSCESPSNALAFKPFSGAKTVTFNYNGGTGSPASESTSCSKTAVTLPTPTWAHHNCTGWFTAASGGTKVGEVGGSYTPSASIEIFAQWTEETKYTATFNNMGSAYGTPQSLYQGEAITKPATDPTACTGYTFVGWSTSQQAEASTTKPTIVNFGVTQTMGTTNINYYAVYSLTEGSGGSSASVTFSEYYSDQGVECTTDETIRENLVDTCYGISTFSGSKCYGGMNGVKFGTGSSAGSITMDLSSAITTNTITVIATQYGSDGGTLGVTINGGTAFSTSKSPSAGTLTYTVAEDVTINSVTVATSTKRAYVSSITIGTGGASVTKYTTSPYCCDLQPVTNLSVTGVTTNSVTLGWTLPADMTGINNFQVVDASNNPVSGLLSKSATSATISGLTECTSYTYKVASVDSTCSSYSSTVNAQPFGSAKTVHLDYQGHGSGTTSFTSDCDHSTCTLPTPEAAGYVFGGWYSEAACTHKVADGGATYKIANTTLFAKWSQLHNITIGTITGSGSLESNVSSAIAGATITVTATPNAGYSLTWVQANGVPVSMSGNTGTFTMPDMDVNLTAYYTAINYTITVTATNGKVTLPNPATITNAHIGQVITLTATANSGYSFSQWQLTGSGTLGTQAASTSFTVGAGDATLNALFVLPNTVSFSVPSCVTAINSIQYNPGSSITLPTPDDIDGYTFEGWALSAQVSETTTEPTTFTGTYSPTGSPTMYAIYSRDEAGYKYVNRWWSVPVDSAIVAGTYVIACKYSNEKGYYTLGNAELYNSGYDPVAYAISVYTQTGEGTYIDTPEDKSKWNFVVTATSPATTVQIQNPTTPTKYLQLKADDNKGLGFGSASTWTPYVVGDYWRLKATLTKTRDACLYAAAAATSTFSGFTWKSYETTSFSGKHDLLLFRKFDKRIATTVTYYTSAPNCLPKPTVTFNNGSVLIGESINLNTLYSSNSTGAVTFTILSGGEYVNRSGNTLTGVSKGTVTVEACQAATGDFKAICTTATVQVRDGLTAEAPTLGCNQITAKWTGTATQLNLYEKIQGTPVNTSLSGVAVKNTQSGTVYADGWCLSGSNPTASSNGWRFYQSTTNNTIYSPVLSTFGTVTASTEVKLSINFWATQSATVRFFATTPVSSTTSPEYNPIAITIDGKENVKTKELSVVSSDELTTITVVISGVTGDDRVGFYAVSSHGNYYLHSMDVSVLSTKQPAVGTYPVSSSPAVINYEFNPEKTYSYTVQNGSGDPSNEAVFRPMDCGNATITLTPSTLTMETLVGGTAKDTILLDATNIITSVNPTLTGLSTPFTANGTYTLNPEAGSTTGKIAVTFTPTAEGVTHDTLYVQVGDSVRMVTIIGRACSSTFVESGASNASGISENSATANFMTTTGFLMVSENGRLNTDLLTNGNFEFGSTAGWGINANSTAQTPTITTTGKYSGTYGAYVEVSNAPSSSALSYGGYNYGGLYAEQMTLSPGTYTMTAYITGASSTTKQEYNNGRFYFGIWNSKGVIGRSSVTNVNTSEKKWIQITGTFELTETTTGYPFVAHQNAKDGYWIDDITLICTNAGASDHFYEYPITNQSSYSMTGLKPSTSYSYYVVKENGCASNTITFTTSDGSTPVVVEAEDVRITAQKGGSANGVFVVNTTTAYSTIYLTKGATSGSCDCDRITLMTNTVSSLGGVVNFNFTPKNTDAEGDEGVCTIQMMTNGMSDPATVNIYWSVQAGCDPSTPTIEVTDIGSDFLTVEHNINLGDDESIQIAFYKGADSASIVANQGDEIFFSKYYEAYMHKKLWAIYNPTAKKRSLAGMQVWRSRSDYSTWFQESDGAHKVIDLSNLGRFEPGWIYPNEEIIVYTANQVGSCEASKAPNMGDWAAFSSNDQSLSFDGDDALLLVRKQSECSEERNNIPPDTTVTGESLSWRLFEDAKSAGWWMIDMIGARKKDNTPDGSACRNWTDPANGESGDEQGWVKENGFKVDDSRPYLLSTNRCLLIRMATVKSGAQAVQENVGDMYTLANEWKGIHVPTKPADKQDSISCENFSYVGNFDYEDYYSRWTALEPEVDYKEGEQQDDGGWYFYDFPMAPYFCQDLLIEVVKETDLGGTIVRDVKKSQTYHVPIVIDKTTTTADPDYFVEPDENNILNAAICKDCDIVIRDGAKLQHVTGGYSEFHDIHVYAKGLLEINNGSATGSELKLHALYMYASKDTISYAIINNKASGSDSGIRADRINHVKRVDDAAWYHICLPYDCKISSVYQLNGKSMGSYGTAAGVWVIKEYDGAERQTKQNESAPGMSSKYWKEVPYDGMMLAGKAYTLGIYENDTIGGKVWEGQNRSICFPSTSTTKYEELATSSKTTTIYKWASGYTTDVKLRKHMGWNFTGSPYITKFNGGKIFSSDNLIPGDINDNYSGTDVYVSVPIGGKNFQQIKASLATIHPFTGYFVQAKSDGTDGSYTLTYNKSDRQLAPARAAEDQRIDVELNIKAAGIGLDNAGIIVDDEFTADYEIGADLVKWYAEDNIPQLFTIATDETMLAYNAMPTAMATNIPLGIYAPKAADYTLTIREDASRLDAAEAVLLLYKGKIVADLMLSDYTITADKAGQINGYSINIPRARKITTDVDRPDIGDPYAIVVGGQLTIANLTAGARVYIMDMLGHVLYNDIVIEDALTLDIATQGVYNIVVTSEAGTSTIKTVIR